MGMSDSYMSDHILIQQYQGDKARVISDDTYVLVLLPNVYVYHTCTRALHMDSQWQILDCGSGSNCSEEQGYDKDHTGDVRANRG